MIKIAHLVFIAGVLFLLLPASLLAHPGRTASDGCHYCRTNCSSWGEVSGARHCHGGYVAPTPTYVPTPTYEAKPTIPDVDHSTADTEEKSRSTGSALARVFWYGLLIVIAIGYLGMFLGGFTKKD